MPKDRWLAIRAKDAVKRSKKPAGWSPKFRPLKHPVEVPVGTSVLAIVKGEKRNHTTRVPMRFTHFKAASAKALMFEYSGCEFWVSKSLIGYK